VRCGSEIRCAKVYKDVATRSFKQAVVYQEGRKVRNSRRQRAMDKGSKFGRNQQEKIWQTAEVDALYKLNDAGVRVPEPFGCFDGVLLMELITDGDGGAAPRLNDIVLSAEEAIQDHEIMMVYILRMLCVGLVHGDLSEFNVLVDETGPVIIDLPQAVYAAENNHAKDLFHRDVANITHYYAQYAPELANTHYAEEIWDLYEQGELDPDTVLTGQFDIIEEDADVDAVLLQIQAAYEEERERQERMNAQD